MAGKRMKLSVVIPTCALGKTTGLSSGRQPYAFRAYLLRCFTLPLLRRLPLHEIIVVGDFESGAGYTYVPCPSIHLDAIHSALDKREAGFRASSGEWIAYLADDHIPHGDAFLFAYKYMARSDVVSFNRRTRMRVGAGEELNCGMGDGYINGHGAIYRHDVLEQCPWRDVPHVFSYDISHTLQIKEAGFHIMYAPDAYIEDCEYGATPWI